MPDSKKVKTERLDQEKGNEVLRRMLKMPPKPHNESTTKNPTTKKSRQGLDEKKTAGKGD